KLNGIKTIYFSLTGKLHKISFAALPISKDTVLSDKYRLVVLNTTTTVTKNTTYKLSASDKIDVFGAIRFDADSTSIKQAASRYTSSEVAAQSINIDLQRDGLTDFFYLPGTEQEIKMIVGLAEQNKYPVNFTA